MKRLSKNFFAILLSDASRRFLGFLTLAYLTRRIAIGDFGAINVGITVLSYAMMASSGGLSSYGTRAVARGENPSLVSNILSLRLVSSFIAYVLISVVAVLFVSNDFTIQFILLFGLLLYPNALFLDWYFQGKEQMGVIGLARLLSAVLYLILIFALVSSSSNLFWVPIAALLGDALAAAALIISYKRRHPEANIRFDLGEWKSTVAHAFPLGAGSILAHFSISLPPIVLGILMSNTEVGIYSAAGKLIFFLLMLDRVIATLLLPASTRLHAVSSDMLSLTLRTALKWIVVMALPLCVGGTILADRILPFIFGSQYVVAAGTLRILLWYFFFTLVHTIFTTGLVAIGKEGVYGKVMLVSAVIYGVSIIFGTLLFGVTGAAGAVVASEAITLLLMRQRFSQFVRLPWPIGSLVKAAIASIIMAVVVVTLSPLHVLLLVLVGGCAYVLSAFALRAITLADVTDLLRRV
ncbi:MAG: flippase [Ignavibacteriae bacterium]|nr:flippase [Ignavibacteria bacterium]MBI3363537.1 flippase [Ignavibacteriota bacterium]